MNIIFYIKLMQARKQKKWTKGVVSTIKFAVTLGGIVYIFQKVPFFEAIGNWTQATWPWLAVILF